MHDTKLPLWKWFLAVYMMVESKKGVSANQLKRTLDVSYRTAWYLCHRIREALKTPDGFLRGIVEVDGTYVGGVRRNIGNIFQDYKLLLEKSVFENVAFPLREQTRLPEPMIRDLVLMKLHAVGLRGARDLFPAQLSGGMSRRVALARAIALDPDLVMFDEPFAGQDPISMGVLMRLIRSLNDALGLTSIVVSHDLQAPKEDQAFWHRLQALHPFNPQRTLLIDDTERVLQSARDYGIAHLLTLLQPDSQRTLRLDTHFPGIHHFDEIMHGLPTHG